MAFFKFRKGGDEQSAPAPAPESIEAMRKRARYRLAGAFVLVLVGVIGFPLLFDNQPRPIAVDIPIDIPDKAKARMPSANESASGGASAAGAVASGAKPVVPVAPAVAAAAASASAPSATPAPPASVAKAPAKSEEVIIASKAGDKPQDKPTDKPVAKPAEKVAEKTVDKAADKTPTKADEAARAKALLEGKAADAKAKESKPAADKGRFVVQFGSFTDVAKSREARQKVEKAGMKTYAQIVQSGADKKIRVRVGPFESKSEAEKVAAKIKKLDLPTAILEL